VSKSSQEYFDSCVESGSILEQIQNQSLEEWYESYHKATPIKPSEESIMDMKKYTISDSPDLLAKDYVGKNLKVKISAVSDRNYPEKDGKAAYDRGVLSFEGKNKTVVLSPTNSKTLAEAYGWESDGWIGHEIGLTVQEYETFQPGWIVNPLDVKAPEFDDEFPA